jgi:hypothetical protein
VVSAPTSNAHIASGEQPALLCGRIVSVPCHPPWRGRDIRLSPLPRSALHRKHRGRRTRPGHPLARHHLFGGTASFRRWRRPPAGVSPATFPAAVSAGWGLRLAGFSSQGGLASASERLRNMRLRLLVCVRSPPRSRIPPPAATRGRRGGKQGRSLLASTQRPTSLGLVDSFHVEPPERARGYSASACHDRCSWKPGAHRPGVLRAAHPARRIRHMQAPALGRMLFAAARRSPAHASRAACNSRRV